MTSTPQDLTNQIIGFLPWTTQALVSKDIYNAIKAKLHAGKIILRAMRAHKIRIQTIIEYDLPCSIDLIRANYILYYPHDLRFSFAKLAIHTLQQMHSNNNSDSLTTLINIIQNNDANRKDFVQTLFKVFIQNLNEEMLAIIGW